MEVTILSRKNLLTTIRNIAEPIAEELGYDLVDLEFVKEGKNHFLRIFIDKPGGVNLDDCQKMSQLVDSKLDEEDPIDVSYYLEVSSPGLDRPLKTDKDLKRNLGKEVEVKLYEPYDGKKILEGILEDYKKDEILLKVHEDKVINLSRSKIALIKLAIKF
ncbi:MAG: ribosome maturation factor RimP [Tissierellia bacterium]|nr:ribosome maturation factor RimP [Tissierellia bacterium]